MVALVILFGGGYMKNDDDDGEENDDKVDLELQYDTSSTFVPRFNSGEI
jgi:hypothetical protein